MTIIAMLTCIALVIFILEMQMPPIVAIPGIKPGLSNVITLFALVSLGRKDAFAVLALRILISCIFTGNAGSFIYSLSGGMLSFIVMTVVLLLMKDGKIPVISILGAISHNIGQILSACLLMGDISVIYYLPVLILSGVITGFFTGICAMYLINNKHIMQLVK